MTNEPIADCSPRDSALEQRIKTPTVRRCSLTLLSETAISLINQEFVEKSGSDCENQAKAEAKSNGASQLKKTYFDNNPKASSAPRKKVARSASIDLGVTAKNHRRHVAQHHYRDYATESANINDANRKRKPKGGVTVPFPIKLHEMLDEIEKDGLASVISWQPHGRAFVVHKPKEFVARVLPEYFKQSKFSSFQRQLNLYGFSRLSAGSDKGGYYHEFFLRGKSLLSLRMTRTEVKGTGVRGGSNPDTEPNFYNMPPVIPDPRTTADDNLEKSSELPQVRTLDFSNIFYSKSSQYAVTRRLTL